MPAQVSTRVSIAWPPTIPPSENTDTLVLTFPSNHFIDLRPFKSSTGLDWGLAGYQIESPGNKTTFIHAVDSRVPRDPGSVKDEGIFHMLDTGDCLEIGTMLNPDTGTDMAYEELWRILPIEGEEVVLIESVGPRNKMFLGRIGKWFQGIGTMDGEVHAKRSELVNGQWEDVFVMGDAKMVPVIQAQYMEWKEGDEVNIDGRAWTVLDCALL